MVSPGLILCSVRLDTPLHRTRCCCLPQQSQLPCNILFHIQVGTDLNHGRCIIGADVGFA
jgi:hypothetical protein